MLNIIGWLIHHKKMYSSSMYKFNIWWVGYSIFMLVLRKEGWVVWLHFGTRVTTIYFSQCSPRECILVWPNYIEYCVSCICLLCFAQNLAEHNIWWKAWRFLLSSVHKIPTTVITFSYMNWTMYIVFAVKSVWI